MQEKESGDSFIQIKPFKSTAKTTTPKKSQQEKKINNDPRIFFLQNIARSTPLTKV
jgi:CRISPR/Cas system CSM-associated protein Csm5 (group 7 of RAMP superfamily)